MFRVGLTGGMGSGKTTVARIFETLRIPVYYADNEAKRLMETNPVIVRGITGEFGQDAYINGKLNRVYLAQQVFNDPERLLKLNAIVHPVTIEDAKSWMTSQTAPYAVKEAALIFESGSDTELDFVIGVSSPLEMRIENIVKRDGIPESEILSRMKNQMDDAEKLQLCDAVIFNDQKQLLIPQVVALHEKLLQLAAT